MRRFGGLVFPVAAMCLLLAGCAHFSGQGREPAPSGAILVSVSGRAVYLVDPSTGDRRTLAEDLHDFQDGFAAWAPDRRLVAYANDGILVLDPRTNRTTTVVGGSQFSMPAWSADRRTLAYGDGLAVWLASAGGEGPPPRRIAGIPAILGPVDMDWSSVGAIAFEGVQLDCSAAVRCSSTGASDIWKVQPDGTGLQRLTAVRHAELPRWAPDGNRLLFVRGYPGTGDRRELWRTDAVGSAPRRVLAVPDVVAADWSPDGRRVAVLRRGPRRGTMRLWVANADGTGLRSVGGELPGTDGTVDW